MERRGLQVFRLPFFCVQVSQFLQGNPTGCVLLLGANMDDLDGKCSEGKPAQRIEAVAKLLVNLPSKLKPHPLCRLSE